jgi:hypothetical protein
MSVASFSTLSMVVSLRGTFGDSIDDLCVVFFTRLIIRKGVQVKKIYSQIEVKCLAKGPGDGNGMPHAGQGLTEVCLL